MKSLFIYIDVNIIIYEKNTFAIRSPEKLQTINPYTHSIQFTFTEIDFISRATQSSPWEKYSAFFYIILILLYFVIGKIWPDKYYLLIFIFNFKHILGVNFLIITEK